MFPDFTRLTPRKQNELAVVRQAMEMQAARLVAIAQPEKDFTRLTPRKQNELAVVRQAMEMQAARLVAIAQPEKQLDSLRARALKIVDYQSVDKPSLASYSDWQFHVKLVAASGCRLLNDRYEGITALAMVAAMNLDQNWYESDVSHLQVVGALDSGDPEVAAATVQQHLGAEPMFFGTKR